MTNDALSISYGAAKKKKIIGHISFDIYHLVI